MLILPTLMAALNRPFLGRVHHVFHLQAAQKKCEDSQLISFLPGNDRHRKKMK